MWSIWKQWLAKKKWLPLNGMHGVFRFLRAIYNNIETTFIVTETRSGRGDHFQAEMWQAKGETDEITMHVIKQFKLWYCF